MSKVGNVFCVLSVLFVVWVAASWIDINQHNNVFDDDYKDYASWNLFEIVFGDACE